MTSVSTIQEVCSWLETEVASKLWLKVPNDNNQNKTYPYTEVHPSVYPLYVPTADKTDAFASVPCVCVTPTETETSANTLTEGTKITLRFTHLCWNVGVHSNGIWKPKGDLHYERPKDGLESEDFKLYEESWFDFLNFADATRKALIARGKIGGLQLDPQTPIKQVLDTADPVESYGIWITSLYAGFITHPMVLKDVTELL